MIRELSLIWLKLSAHNGKSRGSSPLVPTIKFKCWTRGWLWFAYKGDKYIFNKGLASIRRKNRKKREYFVSIYGMHEVKDCTTRTLRKAKQIIIEVLNESDRKRVG